MKNSIGILVFAFFAMILNPAIAGDGKKDGPDRFGIRVGYQSSIWKSGGSKLSGSGDYNSFYAGVFKENKIIPMIHLGAGLEYMQAGAKLKSGNNYSLGYLGVPVYLKGKLGPFFALAGVGVNLKITENHEDSDTFPEDFKATDFPAFAGLGFRFLMVSIEGRYHWGLSEINNGIRNEYWQLGAAVSF